MIVTIRDQVARQLTKVADEQDLSPEELVEKAIRELLRAEADRILAREMEAFRALHPTLLQQYPQQYVGIRRGQLVDHDADQLTLYLRLDEQYPDEVILIKQVCPSIEEVYTIRFVQVSFE
ncbi:MAG: hypothetical protein KF893_26790 [Caldilineaceae bacterium]|nr:hypothetical protein [Caldilineaceae bacterium]